MGDYQTFVQMAYCVRVSGGRLSDIGAVVVLRAGRKVGRMGLSRRLRTARGSEDVRNEALVQYAYCARASGWKHRATTRYLYSSYSREI